MKSFSLSKNSLTILVVAGFILYINYGLYTGNKVILTTSFFFIALALLFYSFAFAKNFLFPALLLLVPISFTVLSQGGIAIDFPAEIIVGLLAIVYLLRSILKPTINKKILYHPLTILLFLELLWMLIASTQSNLPVVSYKRCLVRLCFIFVFYLIAAHWLSAPEKRKWFFLLYGIGIILPVVHTIMNHAVYSFSKGAAYSMPQPFYADHTIYGAALALILPALFIFYFERKKMEIKGWYAFGLLFLLLLVLAGEILSFSRAAWISLIVALLFYFLIKIRVRTWMIILGLTIGSCILILFRQELIESVRRNEAVSSKGSLVEHVESVTNFQTDASNLERINRWMCALRMAQEKPLFGFGPGMYQFEYGRFQVRAEMTRISTFRGNRGHAHSELFNALSETGIPGFLLVLIITFSVIHIGLRVIYNAESSKDRLIALSVVLGLMTFYVHGLFNAFMDSDKIVILVFGSIATLVVFDLQQKFNRPSDTLPVKSEN